MTTGTVMLVLATALVSWPLASAQETATWQVENPDHWIGLIDKHTPPISSGTSGNGHFCNPLLGYASGAVAEAAAQKQLWWVKPPIVGENVLGQTTYNPYQIRINWDHPVHQGSDYEKAMTMAHEGLHWHFGPPPFEYRGQVYTSEINDEGVREHEALILEIIADCFEEEEEEEEPNDPGGGGSGGNEFNDPVIGQDVTCHYTYNPLGGAFSCVGLTLYNTPPGWYYAINLGHSVYFAADGSGGVSATVCGFEGSWDDTCTRSDN